MEKKFEYTLGEFEKGIVKANHLDIARDQFQFVADFINRKLPAFVKKKLECVIHDSREDMIRIKSGKAEYKFLATYDINGDHKMRRFASSSFLKAYSEGMCEETVKEVNEETMFAVLKKIWSKHRPGKNPASFSKGILLSRVGYYCTKEKISSDVEIALFGENDELFRVKCGKGNHKVLATFDKSGNPQVLRFAGQEYALAAEVSTYIYECDEISKVTIGKLIVKVCGNEGSDDDENTAFVRNLLQSLITYLEKSKEKVWEDNEVTIYDKELNSLVMKSGKGREVNVVSLDGNGEIYIF